jgi:hypothetical protein
MARRAKNGTVKAATASSGKDVDYTIPALLAIVATVLITALFFAQPNIAVRAHNIGGASIATATDAPSDAACEVSSLCDGTRLIRQQADCSHIEAFCTNGCTYVSGDAVCS